MHSSYDSIVTSSGLFAAGLKAKKKVIPPLLAQIGECYKLARARLNADS